MDFSPLWISLKTTSAATLIAFVLGIYGARLALKCGHKWRGMVDVIFTLPMVLPPTVVGFILLVMFGKRGIIGSALLELGIQIIFSWEATVIAATVVAFPLVYRTTIGALEQIDPNILNAARTLGMNETTIFFRITLPMAWPGIVAGLVLGFARALGEFGATLMLAGAIPGRTLTMPLAIYFSVQSGDMASAKIWVGCILLISFVSMIAMNYMNKWTYRGGR